ncbi:MAG: 4-(cytidine 5'-diphospho)-2-C-methyl-D-erythritol kinase [Solirubrobacteraceae bacterium]
MRLRALAPGKVNLCLFLGAVRADGRHELVTLFESLSLADELVLELADGAAAGGVAASGVAAGGVAAGGVSDRVICPGVEGDNLALAAIAALRARGWTGPPLQITITKRIPVAAGMAGGSADAAAALRLAAALAPVRPDDLGAVAASLGADVPSQLSPGLSVGTGAGELVQAREPLAPHAFVILPSAQRLSTGAVYREADRLGLARSREQLRECRAALEAGLSAGARLPAELIVNDLAPAALSLCPSIAGALSAAAAAGAEQAIVCGSGPVVAGVFWGQDAAARAAQACRTLARTHPNAVAATPVAPALGAVVAS